MSPEELTPEEFKESIILFLKLLRTTLDAMISVVEEEAQGGEDPVGKD